MDVNNEATRSIKTHVPQSQASVQKYEDEWFHLFNNTNLEDLRKKALVGHLRASRFRSLCWQLLLNVLPADSAKWLHHLVQLRLQYSEIKQKLACNPWTNNISNDDPLSQNDSSLWNQHFCDEELRAVIKQDVVRTFPGVDFFRKPLIQEIMVSILFTYAREHPIMCYRQGMHELLAPLLFVLHCDHQAMLHTEEQTNLDGIISEIFNPNYLEEDGYYLFTEMMRAMESCYHINNVAPTASGYFPTCASPVISPDDSKEYENEVVSQLNIIRDTLLQSVDPELCEHLKKLDITLPLFGIRWLRLLFGREFPLQDLLVLWDAIFSQGKDFKFVHYIVVAMLVAIRKQLLEGDYTACLMYLMRYPANVDVTCIIEHALHLHNPKMYPNPPIKLEVISNMSLKKKNSEKPIEVRTENPKPVRQVSPIKQKIVKKKSLSYEVDFDVNNAVSNDPQRLVAELKHARSVMSLSRLKLQQYHKVLSKAIQHSENYEYTRDAILALDGIHELCNLLTSRYYNPSSSEVEHAVEAGEVRPTDLNLKDLNIKVNLANKHVPKAKIEEMKVFSRTEGISVRGAPMVDPTNRDK